MNRESLGVLLYSGNVKRFHVVPTIKEQTVGQHTWRAMVILHWLYAPGYPPPELTHALLVHDMPELATGDTPGDVKASSPSLNKALEGIEEGFYVDHAIKITLHPLYETLVKFCDRADLVMSCLDEIDMGNRNVIGVVNNAVKMLMTQYTNIAKEKQRYSDELVGRVTHFISAVDIRMVEMTKERGIKWQS